MPPHPHYPLKSGGLLGEVMADALQPQSLRPSVFISFWPFFGPFPLMIQFRGKCNLSRRGSVLWRREGRQGLEECCPSTPLSPCHKWFVQSVCLCEFPGALFFLSYLFPFFSVAFFTAKFCFPFSGVLLFVLFFFPIFFLTFCLTLNGHLSKRTVRRTRFSSLRPPLFTPCWD